MELIIHLLGSAILGLIQLLPLRWVARLGRGFGRLAWFLDRRHRRVAIANLSAALGNDLPPDRLRWIAREHFRRLGENYLCAVRTATMSPESLAPHFELNGVAKLQTRDESGQLPSRVVAIGHFGNFELHARVGDHCPGYQCVTTYRSFDQPALDRLFLRLRNRSGCRYFERRSEAGALRAFLSPNGQLVGLLADQHAGDSGLRLPFFGQECSTSAAPAVFARRYHCRLHVAICYRIALARWRIEIGDEIPTHVDGQSRSSAEIMSDVNQAYEAAVRRDPANWFWVHRRWKPAPPARARQTSPAPAMAVVGEDG